MKKLIYFLSLTFLTLLLLNNIVLSAPINSFVNSVFPKQNEVSASMSGNIDVTFTGDMNVSTLTSSNIYVYGMQTGLRQCFINYNNANKTVTINPVNNFKAGEEVSVILTSGIQTTANVPITQLVYTFTVETTGGNGLFTQTAPVDTSIGYWATGDMDNDGDLDLAAGSFQNFQTRIYLNNGSASFTLHTTIPKYGRLTLADFRRTGDLDLLINVNDSLHLYSNNGSANFNLFSSAKGKPGQLGDMNGDGYIDIVFLGPDLKNHILKNTNGSFMLADSNIANACTKGDLRIYDYNNDGFMDIGELTDCFSSGFFYDKTDRNIIVYYNSASGSFTRSNIFHNLYEMGGYYISGMLGNFESVDYDGDGNMDFVSARLKLRNTGSGNFVAEEFEFFYSGLTPGDFISDGKTDLASSVNGFAYPGLMTYKNNGGGNFSYVMNNALRYSGSLEYNDAIPGDFDNDGDIDIVNNFNWKLTVLLNDNCPQVGDPIEGPTVLILGNVYKFTNPDAGTWTLHNTENANAFIVGSNFGDSIIINPGTAGGRFLLDLVMEDGCGGAAITRSVGWIFPCELTGNNEVTVNTSVVYHAQHVQNAHWTVSNETGSQAYIVGSSTDDSVVVNTGGTTGVFNLLYGTIDYYGSCAMEIHVEAISPVELSSFNSTVNTSNVTLNWSTSSEENNSGFEIQRMKNNEWINLGFINGNGNSASVNNYSFEDRNLNSGKYNYRLKQIDYNGNFKFYNLDNEVVVGVPDKYSLSQNYPNPFNPSTTIKYDIPKAGNVTVKIYDVNGREMRTLLNENKEAGYYTIQFNASELSSGVYFYTIQAGDFVSTKKMMLLK